MSAGREQLILESVLFWLISIGEHRYNTAVSQGYCKGGLGLLALVFVVAWTGVTALQVETNFLEISGLPIENAISVE